MKICERCGQSYPDSANYCMTCGRLLAPIQDRSGADNNLLTGGWRLFFLTLAGSLLVSWLLIVVLGLPVFVLGAFLPLFWFSAKKR